MIALIIVLVGLLLFAIGAKKEWGGFIFMGLFAFVMGIVFALCVPFEYMDNKANIAAYRTFGDTVETQRKFQLDPLERVMIAQSIAEWNVWLAKKKYYNNLWITDCYIPDEIDNLVPIQ